MDGEFNVAAWKGGEALLNQRVCRVSVASPEHLDPGYLRHLLPAELKRLEDQTPFATVKHLSVNRLRSIEVTLPPIWEQRRIAAILDRADALGRRRRASLEALGALRKAAFHSALGAEVANSWPVVKVEDVAAKGKGSIRTGPFGSQLLHSEFVDEGIAVLGIDNAVHNEFRWGEERYITLEKYAKLKRYTVHPGDVLVTIMGTCGRVAVVPGDIPTAINTKHLCCITVDRDRCLPKFLHASLLWQPISRSHMQRSTKGAIMSGLNMGIVKATPLLLPPIEVQGRIVEELDTIDGERERHERSLQTLDDLFYSLQSRAFSGRL